MPPGKTNVKWVCFGKGSTIDLLPKGIDLYAKEERSNHMGYVNRKKWYVCVLVVLLLLSGCTGRQKDPQNETQFETQDVTQSVESTTMDLADEAEDFTGPFVTEETDAAETEATEETKAPASQGGSVTVPKETEEATEEPTEEATEEPVFIPSSGGNGENTTSDDIL